MRPGSSVGGPRTTATAGLVVTPRQNPGAPLLLVNAHIVAGPTADGRLYSPGLKDRHGLRAVIGEAERIVPLSALGPNRMDAALVRPHRRAAVSPLHPVVGALKGHLRRVQPGWQLLKVSRTTGQASGVVVQIGWSGFVRYPDGPRFFQGQVVIHNPQYPIALEGDSGAVWISQSGAAVAMGFAGSDDGHYAFATPIGDILETFDAVVGVPA